MSRREELLRNKVEDEARKAGTLAPQVDAEGNTVNPHIPEFMAKAPWYLEQKVGLAHQRKPGKSEIELDQLNTALRRGKDAVVVNVLPTKSFEPGSCTNCGARTHQARDCLERPRKVGAWKTGVQVRVDDVIQPELGHLSYDAAHDQYRGYNPDDQMKEVAKYSEQVNERVERKKRGEQIVDDAASTLPPTETTNNTSGPSEIKTSLRVRTDTAKYLLNLDPNSAYYDPKTRSMRGNPLPHVPVGEALFAGDNFSRSTGEAAELAAAELFAARVAEQVGEEAANTLSNPTQLALAKKEYEARKQRLMEANKNKITDMYGTQTHTVRTMSELPAQEVSHYAEWNSRGMLIKGQEKPLKLSKWELELGSGLDGNHTHVWGSWFDPSTMSWGYECCWQTVRNSYCTGEDGRRAAKAAQEFAKVTPQSLAPTTAPTTVTNIDVDKTHKTMKKHKKKRKDQGQSSTTSSSSSSDLDRRHRKKHKSSSKKKRHHHNHGDVSHEEMEAWRMKRKREGDPMSS